MSAAWIYCPHCGTSLTTRYAEGRSRRYCPDCDRLLYRNPKPCAGVFVVEGKRVLLVRRTEPPDVGSWSIPAGYLEWNEPPRKAAVRELAEETGLETSSQTIQLLDTEFVEHPDGTCVLVVIYVVSRTKTTGEPTAGSDADEARFWTVGELEQKGESIETGHESTIRQVAERCGY